MSNFASNSTKKSTGNKLLMLCIVLACSACSSDDKALDAQVSEPAAAIATAKIKPAQQMKIREMMEEKALLSLEDTQLRRAEYTDAIHTNAIDVPVMSELAYQQIRIALNDTAGAAELKVEMQPALKQGHWLMFFIDEQAAGAAIPVKDASLQLPKLPLGEHLLRVDVLDETLMVLQSSRPHIIYVEDALAQPLAAN